VPVAVQNPGMIDFGIQAWGGNLWNRVPQITARYKTGDVEATLGVLHARVSSSQDQQENMPWVMGRLAWSGLLEQKGVLAIGGGYRANTITPTSGLSTGIANDASNYLLALEAKLPLDGGFTVTAEGWTGAGIGADFLRTGLDYDSTGEEMAGTGGFVSLEYKLDAMWSCNAGIGIDQPHDDDTTIATAFAVAVPYDSNRTLFANVRCQLNPQTGVGFEVVDTHTELAEGQVSGDDGSLLRGQRFTLGMWYIF